MIKNKTLFLTSIILFLLLTLIITLSSANIFNNNIFSYSDLIGNSNGLFYNLKNASYNLTNYGNYLFNNNDSNEKFYSFKLNKTVDILIQFNGDNTTTYIKNGKNIFINSVEKLSIIKLIPIKLESVIVSDNNSYFISKKIYYGNGTVIKDSYYFDINNIFVPISHDIEVINGLGKILNYTSTGLENFSQNILITKDNNRFSFRVIKNE